MLLCSNAEPYRYQLRAYIYQARDLLSGDSSGLSGYRFNCFLRVKCMNFLSFVMPHVSTSEILV